MIDYEETWRERMTDYAPSATDAEWQAMERLLPPPRRGRGWRKLAGWAMLLLLSVIALVVFTPATKIVLSSFPVSVPAPGNRAVASEAADIDKGRTLARPPEPSLAPVVIASDTLAARLPKVPTPDDEINDTSERPHSIAPLPGAGLMKVMRPYSLWDSLLHRLPPVSTEAPSRSYYPKPLFDQH